MSVNIDQALATACCPREVARLGEIARLRAAARQDAETLDRYRYAVSWVASDSWDWCPSCKDHLVWARSMDEGSYLSQDKLAAIGKGWVDWSGREPERREVARQDAEAIARLREALVDALDFVGGLVHPGALPKWFEDARRTAALEGSAR